MNGFVGKLATTGLATAILVFSGAATALDEDQASKYRQATMKALGGHAGAVARIVKGQARVKRYLPGHTAALAAIGRMVKDLFPPG